jgi:hypothetical protein
MDLPERGYPGAQLPTYPPGFSETPTFDLLLRFGLHLSRRPYGKGCALDFGMESFNWRMDISRAARLGPRALGKFANWYPALASSGGGLPALKTLPLSSPFLGFALKCSFSL